MHKRREERRMIDLTSSESGTGLKKKKEKKLSDPPSNKNSERNEGILLKCVTVLLGGELYSSEPVKQ